MRHILHYCRKLRPILITVVIFVVCIFGICLSYNSHAASATIALETEDGSLSGGAASQDDPAASGAKTVKFGQPAASTGRMVHVNNSEQLTAALADAQPGDIVQLADGNYTGSTVVGKYTGAFAITHSGTATAPITLTGSRAAILAAKSQGSHYALYLVGAKYWNISGITVTNASKGIVLDGCNHITLDNLHIYSIGSEGIHFRSYSSDNVLKDSLIEQTGMREENYGEGIYIGSANSNWETYTAGNPDASDRNQIIHNTIRGTGAENIDIKEGTTGGLIDGNSFDAIGMNGNFADSWIDLKGNGYSVIDNTGVVSGPAVFHDGFQIHQAYDGWGNNNVFHKNNLDIGGAAGVGFYQQAGVTGNIFGCDNIVKNSSGGFATAGIICTP